MKVEIVKAPPPLKFGEGEDGFQLTLKRYSGGERAAVVDAIASASFEAIQIACGRLVGAWGNVKNADGNDIPLEEIKRERDGTEHVERNFDKVMGAMPIGMQFRVISGIVGFLGIPTGDLESLLAQFGAPGAAGAADPTESSADNTPASASST